MVSYDIYIALSISLILFLETKRKLTQSVMAASPVVLPPKLPEFLSVVDDSPNFHQSLRYWAQKSTQIGTTVHDIAGSLNEYHETGNKHYESGNALSEVLNKASHTFQDDEMLEEPLAKFSDALNRIECYRSMLLTQTQMLGVEPMMNMVKEMEKTKESREKVTKLSQSMHIAWERFASLPHESNIADPQLLDKQAHNMITLKQKYQLLLADYIENVRDTNTTKKVQLLQRVLEHMFAEFSYFNYCCQILKELEPYMTSLFENLQKKQRDYEQLSLLDDSYRREVENKIDTQAQTFRKLYPQGENSGQSHSSSHFFGKVGGFISSGVKDLKKQYKSAPAAAKKEEAEWEVIEDADKATNEDESSHFYVPLNDDSKIQDEKFNKTDEDLVEDGVSETAKDATDEDKEKDVLLEENKDGNTVMLKEEINIAKGSEECEELKEEEEEREDTIQHETDGIFIKNKVAPIEIPQEVELNEPESENVSKRGYLRIKQRGFHKSRYPLLYFILNKEYGELLSQGQDQKQPHLFAQLQLTNVKPCNPTDTDRNYCFTIRTSDAEYVLQAGNQIEYEDWIIKIQEGIMAALTGNVQIRNRSFARGKSLKPSGTYVPKPSCDNAVERIKVVEGNLKCADCDCPQPGWASSNIGVVICIECSGIHRGLGVQISKIKSLSLDKWDNALVEFMECNGNAKINKVLEANLTVPKITRLSTKTERLDYIVAKYVNKAFSSTVVVEQSTEEARVQLELDTDLKDCVDNNVESNENSAEFHSADSHDGDFKDTDDVMCLVKECLDDSHCHLSTLK